MLQASAALLRLRFRVRRGVVGSRAHSLLSASSRLCINCCELGLCPLCLARGAVLTYPHPLPATPAGGGEPSPPPLLQDRGWGALPKRRWDESCVCRADPERCVSLRADRGWYLADKRTPELLPRRAHPLQVLDNAVSRRPRPGRGELRGRGTRAGGADGGPRGARADPGHGLEQQLHHRAGRGLARPQGMLVVLY